MTIYHHVKISLIKSTLTYYFALTLLHVYLRSFDDDINLFPQINVHFVIVTYGLFPHRQQLVHYQIEEVDFLTS